jgi:hypothetical protein
MVYGLALTGARILLCFFKNTKDTADGRNKADRKRPSHLLKIKKIIKKVPIFIET